jgi:hypothetical protein
VNFWDRVKAVHDGCQKLPQNFSNALQTKGKSAFTAFRFKNRNKSEKYSILPIDQPLLCHLHIIQPQREGDGRQASVVPPLYFRCLPPP